MVAFHAEISLFRGGFAGVDIFFVISGYLISGIIFRSVERGTFSFTEFYARRINRIFPALAVVLAAMLLLGWLVLFPPEFASLGRHVAGGAAFISNFFLWSETGYFDSKNKLLLHLWSLAVEEQFYIVWPLVLVTAWKRRWSMTAMISIVGAASLLVNVLSVDDHRNFAFYLPVTRLWELLAGALLVWFETNREDLPFKPPFGAGPEVASVAGLAMIAVSVTVVNQNMPWPGWLAILPVAGTVLVVGPGRASLLNRRVLSNKALVAIGLISYPLYLWHWPLLVLGRLVNEGQLSRSGRLGIVAISILFSVATYWLVEKPIRFGGRKRRSAAVLLPVMACMALIGFGVEKQLLMPHLTSDYKRIVASDDEEPRGATFNFAGDGIVSPALAGDSTKTVALVGDSHATQYWPRFEELARTGDERGPRIILLAYGNCPPLPGVNIAGISWDGAPFRCDRFHTMTLAGC